MDIERGRGITFKAQRLSKWCSLRYARYMRGWVGVIVLAAAACGCQSATVSHAVSHSPESGDLSLLERGRQVAEYRCASCHSISPGVASHMPEAPPFETLYTRVPADRLGERIRDGLMVDHPRMPLLVRLSPDEEAALEAFVASVQHR
jgi:mono/diheme cytochrome c family protein